MNGSLKVVQAIVLLSFVGLFFTSCGGSQTTLGSSVVSGTTPVGQTPASSGTESIEEEEKNATIPAGYSASDLFVTVPDTIDYLNFSSVAGSHSERCSFTSGSVVNDLTCVIEVGELALFFDGIKFQYNVPANQCKYIGTQPYWYYNYEIGTGPTSVSASITKNASGTVISSACTVDGVGPFACDTPTPPAAWNDITFDISDEITPKCKYDTTDEDGGVNCCLGKYNLSTQVITPEETPPPTTVFGKSWGGSVGSCIGGAGSTDWEHKNSAGYPSYLIEKMTPDIARTKIYKVSPPIEKVAGRTNMPIANYFTAGIHTHTGFGTASGVVSAATPYVPARPSVYPYYVDPISDRSGSFVIPGNPHYIFDCLDEAFETNYRIRMLVQEWDTVAALTSYVSTGVSSPVGADEPGTAPSDCPGLSGDDCNQAQDSDNFVPVSGYNNAFPASRTLYFPKHSYE